MVKSEIFTRQCGFGGGIKLSYIGANNVSEYELNPILGYAIVRFENWQNTCQRGVVGYIIV